MLFVDLRLLLLLLLLLELFFVHIFDLLVHVLILIRLVSSLLLIDLIVLLLQSHELLLMLQELLQLLLIQLVEVVVREHWHLRDGLLLLLHLLLDSLLGPLLRHLLSGGRHWRLLLHLIDRLVRAIQVVLGARLPLRKVLRHRLRQPELEHLRLLWHDEALLLLHKRHLGLDSLTRRQTDRQLAHLLGSLRDVEALLRLGSHRSSAQTSTVLPSGRDETKLHSSGSAHSWHFVLVTDGVAWELGLAELLGGSRKWSGLSSRDALDRALLALREASDGNSGPSGRRRLGLLLDLSLRVGLLLLVRQQLLLQLDLLILGN